jgi:pantoate--beta-alanine ligase
MRGLGISENDAVRTSISEPEEATPPMPVPVLKKVRRRDAASAAVAEVPSAEREIGNLVVFAPGPEVMYPLQGDLQDLGKKRGVEVDVKGWGNVMEGASRRESSGCRENGPPRIRLMMQRSSSRGSPRSAPSYSTLLR